MSKLLTNELLRDCFDLHSPSESSDRTAATIMAAPGRRTSAASAIPAPSPSPSKSRKPKASSRSVAVPHGTVIPAVMQSDSGCTLFSKAWWADITKKDEFWKEFEKNVARSTIERRFRSAIGTKHVTLFTEFKKGSTRTPRQAGEGSALKIESDGVDGVDEMDNQEGAGGDTEEGTSMMDHTTDIKPSIEVVVPSLSTKSPAVKAEPATEKPFLDKPCSTYDLLPPPRASLQLAHAPAPASPFTMPVPLLARKRRRETFKVEVQDDEDIARLPAAVSTRFVDTVHRVATQDNTVHDSATHTSELGKDTNNIATGTSTINLPSTTSPSCSPSFPSEITCLRSNPLSNPPSTPSSHTRVKAKHQETGIPPPKKMNKLEEDSAG